MDIAAPVSQEQLDEACKRAVNVSTDEDEVAQLLGLTAEAYTGLMFGFYLAACEDYGFEDSENLAAVSRDMFFTGLLLGRYLYGEVVTDE